MAVFERALILLVVMNCLALADFLPKNYHETAANYKIDNLSEYPSFVFLGYIKRGFSHKHEVYKIVNNQNLRNLNEFDEFSILCITKRVFDSLGTDYFSVGNPEALGPIYAITDFRHPLQYLGPGAAHDSTGILSRTLTFRIASISSRTIIVYLYKEADSLKNGTVKTKLQVRQQTAVLPRQIDSTIRSNSKAIEQFLIADTTFQSLLQKATDKAKQMCRGLPKGIGCDSQVTVYSNLRVVLSNKAQIVCMEFPEGVQIKMASENYREELDSILDSRLGLIMSTSIPTDTSSKPHLVIDMFLEFDKVLRFQRSVMQYSSIPNLAMDFDRYKKMRDKFGIPKYVPPKINPKDWF